MIRTVLNNSAQQLNKKLGGGGGKIHTEIPFFPSSQRNGKQVRKPQKFSLKKK